jgi:hypothetical protein
LSKKGSEDTARVSDKTLKMASGGTYTGGNKSCDAQYLAQGKESAAKNQSPVAVFI